MTCNDRVDLKDKFDVSSHELSPFLITIILTTANADVLHKDASPNIENNFSQMIIIVVRIYSRLLVAISIRKITKSSMKNSFKTTQPAS